MNMGMNHKINAKNKTAIVFIQLQSKTLCLNIKKLSLPILKEKTGMEQLIEFLSLIKPRKKDND